MPASHVHATQLSLDRSTQSGMYTLQMTHGPAWLLSRVAVACSLLTSAKSERPLLSLVLARYPLMPQTATLYYVMH